MKRTVAIQDVHYAHGKPRHNQVLHVYHNWTDEELKDEADVVRKNDIEFRRLKHFIEAHDEIVDALRDVAEALHKQVDGPAVVRPSEIDKFARLYELVNDVDALINRIEGEEAE